MFENLNDFLKQLDTLKPLQDLIKSGKVTRNDEGLLEITDGETTLGIQCSDNGFKVSLTTEQSDEIVEDSEEVLTRREFEKLCDTIDDETFEQVCTEFSKSYMPVKELNDNLTPDNIKLFINCLMKIAIDKRDMYQKYVSDALEYRKSL